MHQFAPKLQKLENSLKIEKQPFQILFSQNLRMLTISGKHDQKTSRDERGSTLKMY